jgi:hypothetical protein
MNIIPTPCNYFINEEIGEKWAHLVLGLGVLDILIRDAQNHICHDFCREPSNIKVIYEWRT